VQILLFIVVFYNARLYSDLILHVIYVALQLYGWYHWLHGGAQGTELRVSSLSRSQRRRWIAVAIAAAAAWGYLMATYTNAAAPYADAAVAATSLVAQWLITRKILESWLFWIAVDVIAIGVYLYKSLYFATGLYLVFLGMAVAGYRAWRAAFYARPGIGPRDDARHDIGEIRAAAPGASTGL
jgi:nicotinamide mononucleotide transporter